MHALAYVMAILGCGEGDLPCDELRVADTHYQSEAACVAASETELRQEGEALYPVLVAQCRRSDEPVRILNAGEVRLPEPEPNRAFPLAR